MAYIFAVTIPYTAITIIFIALAAVVAAFIRRISRDKCLKDFSQNMVTLEQASGKIICGKLRVENTGLEFVYSAKHEDKERHNETSFILYKNEYPNITALIRFHDELSEHSKKEREKELKRTYHPSVLRRLKRKTANVFKTVRDSVAEVINLLIGQMRKTTPAGAVLSSQDKYVSQMKQELMGSVGTSYEPLLERYIGNRAVLEVIEGDKVNYITIGNAKPRGICGSGIIDTIAQLLLNGIIDQAGHFIKLDHPHVQIEDDVPEFVLAFEDETETGEKVVLTEDDIGNLIKSKGAILAAMKVLVESVGLSFNDIEQLFVAGGFGNFLDIENSILIGLLPDIPKDRIKFIGNSSLAGARMCMLSYHAFEKAEMISKQMTSFELSVNKQFMDEFVASLFLPHTDMSLFPTVKEKLEKTK